MSLQLKGKVEEVQSPQKEGITDNARTRSRPLPAGFTCLMKRILDDKSIRTP